MVAAPNSDSAAPNSNGKFTDSPKLTSSAGLLGGGHVRAVRPRLAGSKPVAAREISKVASPRRDVVLPPR